ncbi:MAG: protein translocase subunit SecF [Candidatus Muiribacteriaceae bacterium]
MTNFQFIKNRNYAFVFSAIVLVVCIWSLLANGLNLGIDFTGGSLLHYEFEAEVSEASAREALENMGLSGIIQVASENRKEIMITTGFLNEDQKRELRSQLIANLGSPIAEQGVKRETDIGPTVGQELKDKAMKALMWALLAILIYISARFDFKFAFSAIIALVHDSVITLGIFSLLQRELNNTFIAAILTLLGYSLNDTIVVSDRIRENIKKMKNIPFSDMVNKSINQSLSRTLHTSLTTLIPVLILLFFGGEILKNFAFALMIGVIVGTYSSIFVVAPVITIWNKGRVLK